MASDGAQQRKSIYRTALILSGLTALEFLIAGIKGGIPAATGLSEGTVSTMVIATFVILTLFKAFYIVAEFMHLKHEVKRLIWTILIPFIFIVWFIIALMREGDSWAKQADAAPSYTTVHTEQIV